MGPQNARIHSVLINYKLTQPPSISISIFIFTRCVCLFCMDCVPVHMMAEHKIYEAILFLLLLESFDNKWNAHARRECENKPRNKNYILHGIDIYICKR